MSQKPAIGIDLKKVIVALLFACILSACSSDPMNIASTSTVVPATSGEVERKPDFSTGPSPCTNTAPSSTSSSRRAVLDNPCPGSQSDTSVFIAYLVSAGMPASLIGVGTCEYMKTCFYLQQQELACDGGPSNCTGTPCSGSPETIGDIIPTYKSPNGTRINEINGIWIGTGGGTYLGEKTIGWMYLTADGLLLFQPNFSNQTAWAGSVGASLGKIFGISFSVAPPGGYGAISKWNGMLPPGGRPLKCESKGAVLV